MDYREDNGWEQLEKIKSEFSNFFIVYNRGGQAPS